MKLLKTLFCVFQNRKLLKLGELCMSLLQETPLNLFWDSLAFDVFKVFVTILEVCYTSELPTYNLFTSITFNFCIWIFSLQAFFSEFLLVMVLSWHHCVRSSNNDRQKNNWFILYCRSRTEFYLLISIYISLLIFT